MADLTTLLSKFLTSLWSGTIYGAALGGSTIGIPAIVAAGRVAAKTNAASGTIATYTPAADGLFDVHANVLVTTATTHAFNYECAYTDQGNTSRVLIVTFELVGASAQSSIANANGAVPYHGLLHTIRAKGGTAITLRTQAAGTYTNVVYDADGVIVQVA